MSFTVYDENKIALSTFETYEKAAQYVYNNDDIASFINEERVTAEAFVPSFAVPVSHIAHNPVQPKLLTAAAALQKLKEHFMGEVETIIEQLILEEGQTAIHPDTHILVIKQLKELGYTVEQPDTGGIYVYLPMGES